MLIARKVVWQNIEYMCEYLYDYSHLLIKRMPKMIARANDRTLIMSIQPDTLSGFGSEAPSKPNENRN